MIWKRRRERLTYLLMSGLLAWHTLATIIAPAPDNNVTARRLRVLFQPYLSLFGLDNVWDFFAPTVGRYSELRYVIEDAVGQRHTFVPTDDLSWFHPAYFWFRSWHQAIIDTPDIYADSAAQWLCRRHPALRPVSITLLEYQVGDFWPKDHLSGKHPMDPEFVTVNTIKRVPCTGS